MMMDGGMGWVQPGRGDVGGLRLHKNEVAITTELAHGLIIRQFPQWKTLPLMRMFPEGTDNVMYQLGTDKVVRFPRHKTAAALLKKEKHLLLQLAPHIPLPIPKPLQEGSPDGSYPFSWLVCNKLPGSPISLDNPLDPMKAAPRIGEFIQAMQRIPVEQPVLCSRGNSLKNRDPQMRQSLCRLPATFHSHLLT